MRCRSRLVPTPVPRRLKKLTGDLDALLADPALAEHEQDWVWADLTDARRPEDAMGTGAVAVPPRHPALLAAAGGRRPAHDGRRAHRSDHRGSRGRGPVLHRARHLHARHRTTRPLLARESVERVRIAEVAE